MNVEQVFALTATSILRNFDEAQGQQPQRMKTDKIILESKSNNTNRPAGTAGHKSDCCS